jgi:hypothetical protein
VSVRPRAATILSLIVVSVGVTCLSMQPAYASYYAGYKKCGTFKARDGSKIGSFAKHIGCGPAKNMMKDLWNGPQSEFIPLPNDRFRLRSWPGWLCSQGAGGGGCQKGRRAVAYRSIYPWSGTGSARAESMSYSRSQPRRMDSAKRGGFGGSLKLRKSRT